MRAVPFVLLATPAVLAAQAPLLDEGRLDLAWFGSSASLQPSKALGFQWLKPGLNLGGRTIRLRPWEAPAWLLGKRATKDQLLVGRLERTLLPGLEAGLRRGLKGALPVSPSEGDVFLVGRIVDAVGEAEDALFSGAASLTFDLKLVDGDSGELLAAFHDTLQGLNADLVSSQYARWCEELGRHIATAAAPPATPAAKPMQPVPPVFDLEGALRRIEGLRRDGLLSEEEYQALKKKAAGKAK
ncbi:MAG: hypothetical protein NDI58_00300 [Geothrix sp.]|nr:hypothetical protein [Geothrix sp.]